MAREYRKEVIDIPCECGHGIVSIHAYDFHEDGEQGWDYYLLYYELSCRKRPSVWGSLKERAKLFWCILSGKEYMFYDIVLQREDLIKLRDDIDDLLEMD